jgi:hypothetical protein
MKTQEQVVPVTVSAGASGQVSNLINLPPGKIVAVAAFFRDYSAINSGFVRASIKDVTGFEVSQMQSISNYRDREAGYLEGKKPLQLDGGSPVTVTVQATAPFTSNFLVDFVFVYDTTENC